MAKITVPKEQLEGYKTVPGGVYEFRLDGFKPELTKKKDSVNLKPILVIINHPSLNDQRLFDWLNTGAWYLHDFAHSLGLEMEHTAAGESLPGEFMGPDDEPEKWTYVGPLLGRTGKCRVVVSTNNGKDYSNIDQYYCQVPACAEKHSTALQRK